MGKETEERTVFDTRKYTAPRRQTIPAELEDLDDITATGGDPEEEQGLDNNVGATTNTTGIQKLPREIRNIIAGGIAGMLAKSVVAPIDRIKILYQVSSARFSLQNVPVVAKNIIQNEGITALWKGNIATLARVFPYSGIQFSVFYKCKMFFLKQQREDANNNNKHKNDTDRLWGLTPTQSFTAGCIAGTVSVMCTYPLDLVRAQLAVLRKHKHDKGTVSFLQVLGMNYKQHGGIFGLFRGVTPTLVGILPYSGIAFAINEQGKRKIQLMTKRDLTTVERMQCGALSGLFAQTLSYPIEVTRRRMQTIGVVGTDTAFSSLGTQDTSSSASLRQRPPTLTEIVKDLYKEQGIRGFFKGVTMNWMKGPIAFSISFTAFDLFQELLETEQERSLRLKRRYTLSKKPRE